MTAAVLGASLPHDSAWLHVTGQAAYVDDLPEPAGLLHGWIGLSSHAHAIITRLDLSAVRAAPGVVAVLTAADVPGVNDVGPVFPGDPIFADQRIAFHGQSLFAVAAGTREQARAAAARAVIEAEPQPAILTIDDALAADSFVVPTQVITRGAPLAALAAAPHRLRGRLRLGGQEHFYLEGQAAIAIPGEGGTMHVHSSTQHPTEIQHLVARALNRADHDVVCEVRRMGGAFGGKETQAALFAAIAALLADRTGRPVKLRPDRDDDMRLTGKRHDFRIDYDVGFDGDGRVQAVDFVLASRCGLSPDLSAAVNDRAMFHADNAYHLPHVRITSHRCRTHTVSNTAFRGFGGPQGMLAIEEVMDAVARHARLDPLLVRQRNLYGPGRDTTPYGMRVEDNVLPALIGQLAITAEYTARRQAVAAHNAAHRWTRRGLALTPVKFGISFTLKQMNQAGALLHLYTDGSLLLNHGGTEMGQGLFVKVAQLVAAELGVSLDRVRNTATRTDKVPNTSPTAASAGADLNGAAAQRAARVLRRRLARVAAAELGGPADAVVFRDNAVWAGGHSLPLAEVARLAHAARVQLSATGYYRTPKIHWDATAHQGRPFLYFAYGAAVTEVAVDVLTGEYRLLRTDILHDCGQSLNPAIDTGQIEGGFVQGAGWLTTEELWWDAAGALRTHAPSTYKIPTANDMPLDFRVSLFANRNREATPFRSKAVGEPPLMLAISVLHALRDAVAACGPLPVRLDAPATPERMLMAIEAQRQAAKDGTA